MSRLSPRRFSALLAVTVLGVAAVTSAKGGFNMSAPQLPDATITPGDMLPVTAKDICVRGYAGKVRNVPQAVKEQAYKNYGVTRRQKGEYEVDHLISLELGGSNSIRNLWPQSYKTKPWNARVKDKLENALHDDICSNKSDIRVVQSKIAGNWIAAYKERFPDDPVSRSPTPRPGPVASISVTGTPAPVVSTATAADGQVWVNTRSGVYWKSGSKYYGKTKVGKYMSEADAIKAGFHAAGGQ